MKRLLVCIGILVLFSCKEQKPNPDLTPPTTEKQESNPETNPLENSLLEELYARKVIEINGNQLQFHIPFNLHSLDCGAPDCYTTELVFSFPLQDSLVFPKELAFTEKEHGCVPPSKSIKGNFKLYQKTKEHIVYRDKQVQRTLVVFRTHRILGTTVLYFQNLSENDLTKDFPNQIEEWLDEENLDKIPLRSLVLSRFE